MDNLLKPTFIAKLAQGVNRINPTSVGRGRIASFAHRFANDEAGAGWADIGGGVRIELDTRDFIDRSIFYRSYEPVVQRVLMSRILRNSNFLDIGANIGLYSLLASQAVGPNGHVTAVEANPFTFKRLQRNIAANSATNISALNVAAADHGGLMHLRIPESDTHGLATIRDMDEAHRTVAVNACSMDDIVKLPINTIKIDIEGAEVFALRGARRIIAAYKPDIICELVPEFLQELGCKPTDVWELLDAIDPRYRAFRIRERYLGGSLFDSAQPRDDVGGNFLFTMVPK